MEGVNKVMTLNKTKEVKMRSLRRNIRFFSVLIFRVWGGGDDTECFRLEGVFGVVETWTFFAEEE